MVNAMIRFVAKLGEILISSYEEFGLKLAIQSNSRLIGSIYKPDIQLKSQNPIFYASLQSTHLPSQFPEIFSAVISISKC